LAHLGKNLPPLKALMPQEKLLDLLNYEFYFLLLFFKFYQDVRQRVSCRVLNFAEGVLAKLEK